MRGATGYAVVGSEPQPISIHAPHARCDNYIYSRFPKSIDFNPRTPCEVRQYLLQAKADALNFNPRTPCEVRRNFDVLNVNVHNFNPRTPCEVRQKELGNFSIDHKFQSTHPMRGATYQLENGLVLIDDFNPRTPCEVRPVLKFYI